MTTARYADQFLQCALDESGGDLQAFLSTEQVMLAANLDPADAQAVASLLSARRMVTRAVNQADGSFDLIQLTANGLEEAHRLRRDSRSRAEREVYLHNTLVRWAYENAPVGGRVRLQLFATDEKRWFCGTEVTCNEVDAAVDYLEVKGLLKVERAPNFTDVAPTVKGIDFSHSHMTLRTFMNNDRPAGTNNVSNYIASNVVQGNAPGSNMATGGGNTQTVNQGVDTDALAVLVAQLREVAPRLDLSEQDAQDFAEEVDALEREGADHQRGGRIWRSIGRLVPPALVTATADQSVQQAFEAGSAMFG
ncbi:hypothetical protein AB0D66_03165 [Streptomyces sp. NPDC048270]|uniref:hypothetical protein n=1 Tax=Streptomyces sp. NPDC048270 TaxID=3154615 RepID=UPI00340B0A17